MADVNVITIGGRLVHDPETRQTKGGSPMCKFRLANNRVSFGVVKTVF